MLGIKLGYYGRETLLSCSSQYVFLNWFQVCDAVVFVSFTDGRGSNSGLNVNPLCALSPVARSMVSANPG